MGHPHSSHDQFTSGFSLTRSPLLEARKKGNGLETLLFGCTIYTLYISVCMYIIYIYIYIYTHLCYWDLGPERLPSKKKEPFRLRFPASERVPLRRPGLPARSCWEQSTGTRRFWALPSSRATIRSCGLPYAEAAAQKGVTKSQAPHLNHQSQGYQLVVHFGSTKGGDKNPRGNGREDLGEK